MSLRALCCLFVLLGLPSLVGASIIFHLPGNKDKSVLVRKLHKKPKVQAFRKRVMTLKKRLSGLKERQFLALFGKPGKWSAKSHALSFVENHFVGMSGLRYTDPKKNKDHKEYYVMAPGVGVRVYYHIDGVTPALVILYFRVDKGFHAFSSTASLVHLPKRLAWEEKRFQAAEKALSRRWKAVLSHHAPKPRVRKVAPRRRK